MIMQLFTAQYWNNYCDKRVVNNWLMHDGPYKLLLISFSYLLAIRFGIEWMRYRKPFEIRLPMFMFNVLLVAINLYFFYASFWWTNNGQDLFNFHFPSANDFSERTQQIINLYYYYQISKFIDYIDTVFLVLRKKNDHITVLHVYHHFSVPIVGWLCNWVCICVWISRLKSSFHFICFFCFHKSK